MNNDAEIYNDLRASSQSRATAENRGSSSDSVGRILDAGVKLDAIAAPLASSRSYKMEKKSFTDKFSLNRELFTFLEVIFNEGWKIVLAQILGKMFLALLEDDFGTWP